MAKEQVPTIGRMVHYTLTAEDAERVNRRRTTPISIAERLAQVVAAGPGAPDATAWPAGAQAHIGNSASEGQVVPLIITAVWPSEGGDGVPGINGQAILDGTDVLWVASVLEGDAPGTWAWPPRV